MLTRFYSDMIQLIIFKCKFLVLRLKFIFYFSEQDQPLHSELDFRWAYMPPHISCNISSEITAKAKADANSIRVDDANRDDGRHLDGTGAIS